MTDEHAQTPTPKSPETARREGDAEPHAAKENAKSTRDESREIGGRKGPDPTRFGDWEKNGRCIDF